MKKVYILFVAMLMALAFTSCSKSDQPIVKEDPVVEVEKPVAPAAKVIRYSATVKNGVSSSNTKATVDGELSQVFETGDKLVVTGTGISGEMTLVSGAGTQSAVFSGTLEYTGEGETPADDLTLNATLISTNDKLSTEGNYSKAVVASLAEAVQKYSSLTGTSTYGQRSFNLTQGSTFIEFKLITCGLSGNHTVTLSDESATPYNASNTINIANNEAVFAIAFAGGQKIKNSKITIKNGDNVVWTRLFGKANTEVDLGTATVSTVTDKPKVGDRFYSDGTWDSYRSESVNPNRVALGIIVYANNGANSLHPSSLTGDDIISFADGVTEKQHGFGHALVIAFQDCDPAANRGVQWSTNQTAITNSVFEQEWLKNGLADKRRDSLMFLSYDGIGKTDFMASNSSVYPAAAYIRSTTPAITSDMGCSNWFMPTITQWIASFMGLGESTATFKYPKNYTTYYWGNIYNKFKSYESKGLQMLHNIRENPYHDLIGGQNGKDFNYYYYWSSTQNLAQRAICVGFVWDGDNANQNGVGLAHQPKDRYAPCTEAPDATMNGRSLRAFLAF